MICLIACEKAPFYCSLLCEKAPFYGVSYTSGIVEAVERTQEHASVHATGNFLASSHASILTYSILEENMDWCMLKFSF